MKVTREINFFFFFLFCLLWVQKLLYFIAGEVLQVKFRKPERKYSRKNTVRQFSLVLVKNRKNALYRRNAESEFLSRAVALENRYISGRTIVNAKFTRPSPKESYVNIVRKLCPALPFFFTKGPEK